MQIGGMEHLPCKFRVAEGKCVGNAPDGALQAWGQTDLAPEANEKGMTVSLVQEKGQTLSGEKKTEQEEKRQETYEPSEEALQLLLEQFEGTDRQLDTQNEELKVLKIAQNIMRGMKVPAKDESFLLTKNFKLYMAAKNMASMKECTGTAKSVLGDDDSASAGSGASGTGSTAEGSGSSGSVSIAADGAALGNTSALSGNGIFSGGKESVLADALSNKGDDYSILLEGIKNMNASLRASGGMSVSKYTKNAKTYKRFFYNFKQISAQIVSAKTSGNARQVLSRAKLKTSQIRRKLRTGQYDDEAVQLALTHAEAIERVAKKKMKHLQEEERAKSTGGVCEGDTDEEDRKTQEMQDEQMYFEMQQDGENPAACLVLTDEGVPAEDVSLEELMADATQTPVLDITDEMMELLEEFAELQEETLEDVGGLEELADELSGGEARELDPADLKEMKRKHRLEEQRKIAEADSKYLKAFFAKLQRDQQAAASGAAKIAAATNSGGGTVSVASASTGSTGGGAAAASTVTTTTDAAPVSTATEPAADIAVSTDTAVAAVVAEGGTIDVSV